MKSPGILALSIVLACAEPLDEWVNTANLNTGVNDITYADGLFVAVGNGVEVSNDGRQWTKIPEVLGASIIEIHNGRFVSYAGTVISTSPDGTNWVRRTFSPPQVTQDIAVVGDQIVLVGGEGSYWLSSDAINFQRFNFPTNLGLSQVSSANGLCFASGSQFTFVSTNLIDWARITPPFGIKSVVFAKGVFVAASTESGIYTSIDGTSWARADYAGARVNDLAFAHGYFLAAALDSRFWTSLDGTNWTGRPVPPSSPGASLHAIAASPTRVVVASSSVGYLIRSGEFKPDANAPAVSIETYAGVTIPVVVGRSYSIEATRSLGETNAWSRIVTVTPGQTPFTWFDESSAHQERRFYRAVLLD